MIGIITAYLGSIEKQLFRVSHFNPRRDCADKLLLYIKSCTYLIHFENNISKISITTWFGVCKYSEHSLESGTMHSSKVSTIMASDKV